ncbi:MAG: methyltransferase domain-containing protein [Armatimonadota bacterium]|nr:methyltransferase domain-containing protein [Armatimonadota bacterium]MDR7450409.1 methyltransferase domain-containing protein [Armatimonadota bacterium]MDR7467008.1 methyltransferase domain-containing protein [Armatimonadota bacterium]MDR7493450.1 methyltransferase domain-containing protein [Armatimonadota bacterium]MDR7498715.1 methyltransferase domain-containing protein [Armatimonadota bacterium]
MKAYRERIYRRYFSSSYGEDNPLHGAAYEARLTALRDHLLRWIPAHRDSRIVDLGCGIGYAVDMLARQGYRQVEGIDVSEEQVALAQARGLPVRKADAFDFLAPRREQFDAILALDVIEHFDRDELLRFLDLVAAALKPGGRVIVKTPNANAPTAARARFRDLTHELIFTEHSLRTGFAVAGLRTLSVFGERIRPATTAGLIRWLLGSVTRLAWRLLLIGELGREALRIPVEFNLIAVAEKPDR